MTGRGLLTEVPVSSKRAQPLDRQVRRESVSQSLVRGNQFRLGLDRQCHVQGIVNGAVVGESNSQSFGHQNERRYSRKIAGSHVGRDYFGLGLTPSALPRTFPQNVADLGPENIGHDELDFGVYITL